MHSLHKLKLHLGGRLSDLRKFDILVLSLALHLFPLFLPRLALLTLQSLLSFLLPQSLRSLLILPCFLVLLVLVLFALVLFALVLFALALFFFVFSLFFLFFLSLL